MSQDWGQGGGSPGGGQGQQGQPQWDPTTQQWVYPPQQGQQGQQGQPQQPQQPQQWNQGQNPQWNQGQHRPQAQWKQDPPAPQAQHPAAWQQGQPQQPQQWDQGQNPQAWSQPGAPQPSPSQPGAQAWQGAPQAGQAWQGAPQAAQPWQGASGGGGFNLMGMGISTLLRIVVPLVAVLFVGGAGLIGALMSSMGMDNPFEQSDEEYVAEHVQSNLTEFLESMANASAICGFAVQSTSDVAISDVVSEGSRTVGTGTAVATLTATPGPNAVVEPPLSTSCRATYHFRYQIQITHQGRDQVTNTNLTEIISYRPYTIGEEVAGTLQNGDLRFSNNQVLHDIHGVRLAAGQQVTFVLRGGPMLRPGQTGTGRNGAMDVLLNIYTVDGTQPVASNDDIDYQGGDLDSRIVFTAPQDALYMLYTTTAIGRPLEGRYTLLSEAAANPALH
jgi:hypothetical protein